MAERYRSRVAVVTGGTTGIGRGVVDRLVGEGASVVTCARHAPESTLPDGASFIAADITDEASVSGVIDATVDRYGRRSRRVLASDDAVFITAAVLAVDGGAVAKL